VLSGSDVRQSMDKMLLDLESEVKTEFSVGLLSFSFDSMDTTPLDLKSEAKPEIFIFRLPVSLELKPGETS
jgi:hypothetical protein